MINYYIEEILPKEKQFSEETVFKDYALYWLESAESYLAPKTYQRYSDLLDTINKALGHIHMKNITPYHLQLFYQKLSSEGANRITGGKLSAKTILHYHRLISVILHQATIDGVIKLNIASKDYIKIPKVESNEALFLDEPEIKSVLKALINEPIKWKTALVVLLFTGLRRGELLGLEWQDIDFKNNLIYIKRTSQYIPKYGIITKPPKNKTSTRIISISDECKNIILSYQLWWANQNFKKSNRLFLSSKGEPMHPDSLNDYIKKLILKYDLPKFSPHSLRHTHASLLIKSGIDIATISRRLGHANPGITLKVYLHAFTSMQATAATKISLSQFDCNI